MPNRNTMAQLSGRPAVDGANLTRAGRDRLFNRLSGTLTSKGPSAALSELRSAVLYRAHALLPGVSHEDRLVGTTTELGGLTVTGQNRALAVEYAPTPRLIINWIGTLLPGDASNWTFIDVGAGRGRVVMAAAGISYAEVLGVEFAAELQRDAMRLIGRMPRAAKKAEKVSVVLADATNFEIPDNACIFYLFNPFGAPVLDAFVRNVIASMERSPRPMRIAYFNPVHRDVIEQYPQIQPVRLPLSARVRFALFSPHGFRLYEINTASGSRNRYFT